MWQQWVNVLLGLWIIAVPFVGMTGSALTWALVITGLAVAVLGLWGVQESSADKEASRMMHRT